MAAQHSSSLLSARDIQVIIAIMMMIQYRYRIQRDCQQLLEGGCCTSGVYTIQPDDMDPFEVGSYNIISVPPGYTPIFQYESSHFSVFQCLLYQYFTKAPYLMFIQSFQFSVFCQYTRQKFEFPTCRKSVG